MKEYVGLLSSGLKSKLNRCLFGRRIFHIGGLSSRCFSSSSFANPYSTLGISKTATLDEIKRKFRELAKKYHPDINPSPEAKVRMSEITSAYEFLCDNEKRNFYDKIGYSPDDPAAQSAWSQANGQNMDGFGNASWMFTDFADILGRMAGKGDTSGFENIFGGQNSTKGDDISVDLTIDMFEAINGVKKNIDIRVKTVCSDCQGSGCKSGTKPSVCKHCSGTGIQKVEKGPIVFGVSCRHCNGSGNIIQHPCTKCKSTGLELKLNKVQLDIPKGIRNGMELRIPTQGHHGIRNGKRGNLYVSITVKTHPKFRWIDDDIHMDVPITIKQSLLGDEIFVDTLDKDNQLRITIPSGTLPNSCKVIKSKGPPKIESRGNGNLVLHFKLCLPKLPLTKRQMEIIEEFDAISRQNISNIVEKQ